MAASTADPAGIGLSTVQIRLQTIIVDVDVVEVAEDITLMTLALITEAVATTAIRLADKSIMILMLAILMLRPRANSTALTQQLAILIIASPIRETHTMSRLRLTQGIRMLERILTHTIPMRAATTCRHDLKLILIIETATRLRQALLLVTIMINATMADNSTDAVRLLLMQVTAAMLMRNQT
jgi:hypothetical protein